MKKTKFALCLLLIAATILTFSLPVVADDSGEDTKDTVKKDDSFYLSRETLDRIGDFDKIKVDEDTKYLTVYFGFVSVMHLYNKTFDEFIDILDGVRVNEDEPPEGIQAWEWGMMQKFFIAMSPDGSFQLKRFITEDDGSMHEAGTLDSISHPYDLYGNIDSEKLNEYIPEKVLKASLDDRIIKCIDEEIKVENVYIIESPKPDYLHGWSVCFKTNKGNYIYFYHESIKNGDYLFPADDLPKMLHSSKNIKKDSTILEHSAVGCTSPLDFSNEWPAEIIDRYDVNSENFFVKTGWKNDFSWVKADEPVNTDDTHPTDTPVGVDTDNNQPTAVDTVPVETDVQGPDDNHPIILIIGIALLAVALAALVIGASSKRKNK